MLSEVYAEIVDHQTGASTFMSGVLSIVEKVILFFKILVNGGMTFSGIFFEFT